MMSKNIHEFGDLMKRLEIDVDNLGCVMLPTEPIDIFGDGRDRLLDVEDLYVSDNPAKFWVNGDVSEKAHITLLYGLLTPAYEQVANIDEVLASWVRPEYMIPERASFFPSNDKNEPGYAAIVVEVEDPHLREAHTRLSYLPHVNTFSVYRQHMTLAYVRLEAAQKWMDVFNNNGAYHIYVKGNTLDYGSEK